MSGNNNTPPKSSGGTKKKGGSKKGGAPKSASGEGISNKPSNAADVSLERKPALGMNPVGILTGYYGSRGERIKHTVHDGALKLPKDALDLLDEAVNETGLSPAETYGLPGLDTVIRPSIDPDLDTVIITEISLERVAVPDPSATPPEETEEVPEGEPAPERKMVHVIRTKIENRTRQRKPASNSNAVEQQASAERIRGGGGEEEGSTMDVDNAHPPPPLAAPPVDVPVEHAGKAMDLEELNDASTMVSPELAKDPVATASATAAPVITLPALAAAAMESPTAVPVATNNVAGEASTVASIEAEKSSAAAAASNVVPESCTGVPNAASGVAATNPGTTDASAAGKDTVPSPTVPMAPSAVELAAAAAAAATTANNGASETPVETSKLEPAPVAPTVPISVDPQPAAAPDIPMQPAGGTAQAQVTPTPAPTPGPSPSTATKTASTTSGNADTKTVPVLSCTPSNSNPAKVESTSAPSPATATSVQTLSTKPEPRWELHRPGPNDEMVTPEDQLTPKPDWYRKDGVSNIERTILPEWFDGSAPHRTPESYIKARETILVISSTISNRNLTSTLVRRSIVGDAGSLQRLRDFMSNWGLINEDAINDSAPTAPLLREKYPVSKQFHNKLRDELINAVVEQSNKRLKTAPDNSFVPIDWNEVALKVGNGATSTDCERNFLSMPINAEESENTASDTANPERPITPEVSLEAQKAYAEPTKDAARQEFLRELVDTCSPTVVRKATAAALEAANESSVSSKNLKEAQSGALLGLVAARAVEETQKTEAELESILSQLLDQRMKKLENRMVMMDDVESILEAEKVALELERRDLYTARCRHWFGGA